MSICVDYRVDGVVWQEAGDELAWLGEDETAVFANVLGAQCEEGSEQSARVESQFLGSIESGSGRLCEVVSVLLETLTASELWV